MANVLRSVNTRFWNDPFIEDITPSEKLLFLYLLTNPLCNLLGIYEITYKKISYDTGLNNDTIRKAFKRFESDNKAFFEENFVILPNYIKNQNMNPNMKTAVVRQFEELPYWLREKILGSEQSDLQKDKKPFERVRQGLASLRKIESEEEEESEDEKETKKSKKIIANIENYQQWKQESKNDTYKAFIDWLIERNPIACLSMDDQITEKKFFDLVNMDGFTKDKLKSKIMGIEGWKDNKKYVHFYAALKNWMSK